MLNVEQGMKKWEQRISNVEQGMKDEGDILSPLAGDSRSEGERSLSDERGMR